MLGISFSPRRGGVGCKWGISMSDKASIKAQIIASILADLQALVTAGTVRQVNRGNKLAVNLPVRPSIQLYVGDERPFGKPDTRGRTFEFDLCLKLLNSDARDVATANDLIVPEMQKIVENNIQLGGLCVGIYGGEELPFTTESNDPEGGVLITYTIQYRRVLGDPYTTY